MSHHTPYRRTRPTGRRLLWEALECRCVLSGILYTDPAPGSLLMRSPEAYRVVFDSPLSEFSVGFTDVVIDRVGSDGTSSRAFDEFNLPFASLEEANTALVFTLSTSLEPGVYRILLAGDSMLTAEDGTPLGPLDGLDQYLSEFTISRPGVTFADALDLGTVGPDVVESSGALDFAIDPSEVKLYKFSLAKGHFWRLGLEVSAQRDGSPLNAAITLFDASGRVLAFNDVGRSDAPNDPFLFRGLAAGDYYVGVSGSGNLAGEEGGYDPQTGTTGASSAQSGGEFRLNLVADEADLPGALIGFRVNHTDALDPTPTGFTMRFSTRLDLGGSGEEVFHRSNGGVEVVGEDGTVWPVAATSYDEARGAIQFLFRDRLPKGKYTIRLSDDNPLVDLAGHSPISPRMPQGVLATFRVNPDARARGADGLLPFSWKSVTDKRGGQADESTEATTRTENFGPLTPNLVVAGISRSAILKPGESVVYRFVGLYREFVRMALSYQGGGVRVEILGGETDLVYEYGPTAESQDQTLLADLDAREYFVKLTATGDSPVTFFTNLRVPDLSWDSLLANGLGQGTALGLRLVSNDTPLSFGTTNGSSILVGESIAVAPAGPTAGPLAPGSVLTDGFDTTLISSPSTPTPFGASTLPFTYSMNMGQAGFGNPLDVADSMLGRPDADADSVAAVGPESEGGAVALASVGGLPAQARALRSSRPRPSFSSHKTPDKPEMPGEQPDSAEGTPTAPEEEAAVAPGSAAPAQDVAENDPAMTPDIEPPTIGVVLKDALLTGTAPSETAEFEEPLTAPSLLSSGTFGLLGMAGLAIHQLLRHLKLRQVKPSYTGRRTPAPHSFSRRMRVSR